jgi:iron complex transport system substrate-binding protein
MKDVRVQAIVSKLPEQSPTFAQVTIMGSMGTYITKGGSMTSDIANRLNLKNAAIGMTGEMIPDYVPFSLEKLIDIDPEYLLINFHGDEDMGKKYWKKVWRATLLGTLFVRLRRTRC